MGRGRNAFLVAAGVLAALAVGAIGAAAAGRLPWWIAGLFLGGIAVAEAALAAIRRIIRDGAARERHDERVRGELEAQRDDLQSQVAMQRAARRTEHEWNRKLQERILELQHARGFLGETDDVGALILRTAIELLDAEKGLLLSRDDLDTDGDLDLVVAEGFEHDPEHSAVAQRFAREVLERDVTIREDEVHEDETPADREIRNLVAIPIYVRDRFSGVVVACNKDGGFREHDDDVLLALGDHAGAVLHNARLQGLLRGAYLSTVGVLADAVAFKDPELRSHSGEVAQYVARVAERLDVEPKRREELLFGSLLHDVGKIGISERILLKPAELTPDERCTVELHPLIGYSLVREVPALEGIAPALLHHHERFDGRGYPAGLAGDDIPLEARIIGVADSFSAMTAQRPYRDAMTLDEACDELERCAGSQFDPTVVEAFVHEVRRDPLPLERAQQDGDGAVEDILRHRAAGEPLGAGAFSIVDSLTLLYTHRHMQEVAEGMARRAADRGRPFAVVLAQLADLDRLNREEGYAAGDAALQHVARVIERGGGRWGATACRYGGACLALLVPGAGDELVDRLSEELGGELEGGPPVALAAAVWREGEAGCDVIARARAGLAGAVAAAS